MTEYSARTARELEVFAEGGSCHALPAVCDMWSARCPSPKLAAIGDVRLEGFYDARLSGSILASANDEAVVVSL